MARACSVCSHGAHLDIDRALLGLDGPRLSHREAAARWGLSRASVQRHATSHIAPIMRAVQGQVTRLHGDQMLTELGGLYERATRMLDRAEAAGDLRTALQAVREARAVVETFAKVGLALAQREEPEEDKRPDLDRRIEEALADRNRKVLDSPRPRSPSSQEDEQVIEATLVEDDTVT